MDYTGVIQTKIGMLRQVFDQASFSAERQAAFDAFVAAGGDSLQQQAAFDALQAHFYARATTPGAGRSGLSSSVTTTTRPLPPGWPSTTRTWPSTSTCSSWPTSSWPRPMPAPRPPAW